jgi:cytochrome c oxidase subunit 2
MSFLLIAEPPERFRAWLEAQRRPAREPTDALQARGREVFLGAPCVMCHAITGTSASGRVAPDLTHFGSRRTIGAGTVPNTPGYLGGWIVDAQSIKPGNQMPQNALEPRDLQALIAYLESLN